MLPSTFSPNPSVPLYNRARCLLNAPIRTSATSAAKFPQTTEYQAITKPNTDTECLPQATEFEERIRDIAVESKHSLIEGPKKICKKGQRERAPLRLFHKKHNKSRVLHSRARTPVLARNKRVRSGTTSLATSAQNSLTSLPLARGGGLKDPISIRRFFLKSQLPYYDT